MTRIFKRLVAEIKRNRLDTKAARLPRAPREPRAAIERLERFSPTGWENLDAYRKELEGYLQGVPAHPSAIPALVRAARQGSYETSKRALERLSTIKHPVATFELALMAADPRQHAHYAAEAKKHIPMEYSKSERAALRAAVAIARAHAWGDRPGQANQRALGFLRGEAIGACAFLGAPGRQFLRRNLRRWSLAHQVKALEALSAQGSPGAVRILFDALRNTNPKVRDAAFDQLHLLLARKRDGAFGNSLWNENVHPALKPYRDLVRIIELHSDWDWWQAMRWGEKKVNHASWEYGVHRFALDQTLTHHAEWAVNPDARKPVAALLERVSSARLEPGLKATLASRLSDAQFVRRALRHTHWLNLFLKQLQSYRPERLKT